MTGSLEQNLTKATEIQNLIKLVLGMYQRFKKFSDDMLKDFHLFLNKQHQIQILKKLKLHKKKKKSMKQIQNL